MMDSKTERGGDVLRVKGFDFVERKDRGRDGMRSWRCREYPKNKCPATVKTMNGIVQEGKGNDRHCHGGDPLLTAAREIQSKMRLKASECMESTSSIVAEHLDGVSADIQFRLPKRPSMFDNVRAKRRAVNPVEPNPQNLGFEMPDSFSNIILYDSGPDDPSRIIIMGKQELMNSLEQADLWMGDGTFDVCPQVFYQLYTVHCKIGNSYPPCVYFLLPSKSQAIYIRALEQLKILIPQASPDTILVDFEMAPRNAFHQVFVGVNIKGCLFHHGQSINKKVGEIGLKCEYESNIDFHMAVKSLLALAFVPEDDVLERFQELVEKFEQLVAQYPELARVNELYTYFEVNYIRGSERPQGRGRAPARYPITMWNHYDDPANNVPRTTNAVEGYHNGLNSLFLAKHPSVWTLLRGLHKDMALHLKTWVDDQAVNNPAPRLKYALISVRLATKIASYDEAQDKLAYLRAVAHIFSS